MAAWPDLYDTTYVTSAHRRRFAILNLSFADNRSLSDDQS